MLSSRARFIAAFLAPAVAIYALFVILPLLQAFQMSLYRWRGVSARREFTGLENFARLVQDDVFLRAVKNNLWLFIVGGLVIVALGVLLAHGVQGSGRLARAIRSVYLFPQVISLVVVAIIWMFVFNPSTGLVDGIAQAVGLGASSKAWLGDPATALPAVGLAFVWWAIGFYIMLFAAGIEGIPQEVKEASRLDGASGAKQFLAITWPMLWPIKRVAITYIAINVVNVFVLVHLMTQGGPDRSTEVMLTYLYEQAFKNNQFGYATALAVANFALAMALGGAVMLWFRRNPMEAK
jgi:N-acetylglucosamine transport system permease protein